MTEAEAQLIAEAGQKLGPKAVITDPSEIEPWVTDWRGRVHGASPAILAPASTEEVAEIVKLAASTACRSSRRAATPAWPRAPPRPPTDRRCFCRCGG